jgi:CubicO group peptidase (beta-lactamase class C family)
MNTKRIIRIVIITVIIYAIYYVSLRLPIITGYAAKNLCSCVFVGNRDVDDVEQNDLNFSLIKYAKNKVDFDNKKVTSKILGLAKQTAVYKEGLGCTLLADYSEKDYQSQASPHTLPSLALKDTIPWPAGDLLSDTVPAGVDINKLKNAVAWAFDNDPTVEELKQTLAVLVVYKNQIIAEKYAPGIEVNTPLLGWSMTKSIMSALVGILVGRGKLDINEPVNISSWQNDARKNITLNHLLHMNSGLKWDEDYFDVSDVTRMLYKKGNMFAYAISVPSVVKPDSVWMYSSGTSNIISGLIRHTFDDNEEYINFPREALFNKIGMHSIVIEPDASGMYIGSSYSYATTRDWARFGLLYLNNGVWKGERILPEDWLEYTQQPAKGSHNGYGAQFWLNKGKELKDAPEDMISCQGFRGQRIFIIPSKDLVVVRMGLSHDYLDFNEFLKKILEAFPG